MGHYEHINLAHGAFVMLGAYTAYVLFSNWHVDPFLSLPMAFVVLFVLGYCIQRFVINYVGAGRLFSRHFC